MRIGDMDRSREKKGEGIVSRISEGAVEREAERKVNWKRME